MGLTDSNFTMTCHYCTYLNYAGRFIAPLLSPRILDFSTSKYGTPYLPWHLPLPTRHQVEGYCRDNHMHDVTFITSSEYLPRFEGRDIEDDLFSVCIATV